MAQSGVEKRAEMLMYWRVHCAFGALFALSCTTGGTFLNLTRRVSTANQADAAFNQILFHPVDCIA
jgi:hypothetical protein